MNPAGRGGARRGVAVSLALHAAALTALALASRTLTTRPPDVRSTLELELMRPRRARPSAPAPATRTPVAAATHRAATAEPSRATIPSAHAQVAPPSTITEPSPARGPAAAQADAGAAGVSGALRALLGCGETDASRLAPEARARCAMRLGQAARTAVSIDTIPSEKRAYYDAVAAAYAQARGGGGGPGRTPAGPPRPQVLADRGGVYLPAVGCSVRFGVPRGWTSYHDRPPHSLKLGALPCFLTPPNGRGFEESGVEAPASLRERTDDERRSRALDPPG